MKTRIILLAILSLNLYCGGASGTKKLVNELENDVTAPSFTGVKTVSATLNVNQYEIHLTWDAASDNATTAAAIKYEICYASYSQCVATFISQTSVIGQLFADIYVPYVANEASKTYYFLVRAVDKAGNSDENTKVLTVTTDATAPTFAGATSASEQSGTSIQVNWNLATDDSSPQNKIVYEISCFSAAVVSPKVCHSSFTVVGTVTNLATSYIVGGLEPNTSYQFKVRAKDEIGNFNGTLPAAVIVSATTKDSLPPVFPATVGSQLATTTAGVGNLKTSIKLTWNAATDNKTAQNLLSYDIYRFTSSPQIDSNFSTPHYICPDNPPTACLAGVTQRIADGLRPNTTYYFMVRARDTESPNPNQSGYYDYTTPSNVVNIATVTTAKETEAPNLPSLITASCAPNCLSLAALTSTSIQLVWPPGNDDNSAVGEKTAQNDLVYHVYISAEPIATTDGVTCLSIPVVPPDPLPTPPIIGGPVKCYKTNPGSTSFLSYNLASGVPYYYWVRVKDQSDNLDTNPITNLAATTLDGVAPTFAGANSAAVNGGNPFTSIDVSWITSFGTITDNVTLPASMYFDVYMKQGTGDCAGAATMLSSIKMTVQGVSSATVTGLTPGTQYTFVVRARDLQGNRETNCIQVSATTSADSLDPTFGGATSVSNITSTSMRINWTLGTDNITPANGIQYWVCVSDTNNDCVTNFVSITSINLSNSVYPHVTQVNPYYDISGLDPSTTYYFVVRAKDLAGNYEENVVQVNATTSP